MPSLFLLNLLWADTITLKNGRDLKGLVVEQHEDRIIFSTAKGEIPILRKGVKNIQYDDPEQNFMQVGKEYEAENKMEEALAYYSKAAELNPNFEDAKKGVMRIRNHFWAAEAAGPQDEMDKQQMLYDSWGKGKPGSELGKHQSVEQSKELRQSLGIDLEKKGDWVYLQQVFSGKDAIAAGLKKNDRLAAIDGQSLRYLRVSAVRGKLLLPHRSDFTLDFERECVLQKNGAEKSLKDFGLGLRLKYEGITVDQVDQDSQAQKAGFKALDFLSDVDGVSVRYMSLKKVEEIVKKAKENSVIFTIRRSVMLARK